MSREEVQRAKALQSELSSMRYGLMNYTLGLVKEMGGRVAFDGKSTELVVIDGELYAYDKRKGTKHCLTSFNGVRASIISAERWLKLIDLIRIQRREQ